MTEYTDNYGLNKYGDGDAANLRDQYNASMDIIDTQLKTANDNASNATTILNAAGMPNASKASDSKARWDGAVSSSATNKEDIAKVKEKLGTVRQHNIVVLGDSWTQHDDKAFGTSLAAALNGTLIGNYGSSGAYFGSTTSGTQFKTILQEVNEAPGNADVDIVVVMALANNMRFAVDRPYNNSMEATVNALRRKFPNAELYFAPSYCIDFDNCKMTLVHDIVEAAISNGMKFVNTIPYLCAMNWNKYQSDNIHLTDGSGQWPKLGRTVAAMINGTTFFRAFDSSSMFYFGNNTSSQNITLNGAVIAQGSGTGVTAENVTISTIPEYMTYMVGDTIKVSVCLKVETELNVTNGSLASIIFNDSAFPTNAMFKMMRAQPITHTAFVHSLMNNPRAMERGPAIAVFAKNGEVSYRFNPDSTIDNRFAFDMEFNYL